MEFTKYLYLAYIKKKNKVKMTSNDNLIFKFYYNINFNKQNVFKLFLENLLLREIKKINELKI